MKHKDPDSVLVFHRIIEDLKNYCSHKKAEEFMDLVIDETEKSIDGKNAKHIEDLTSVKFNEWFSDEVKQFRILWRYDVIDNCEIFDQYLNDFCEQFETTMIKKIDSLSTSHHVASGEASVNEEVLLHWQQCSSLCEDFVGRHNFVSFFHDYIVSDSTKPTVISGETGTGKSALTAQIASSVRIHIF